MIVFIDDDDDGVFFSRMTQKHFNKLTHSLNEGDYGLYVDDVRKRDVPGISLTSSNNIMTTILVIY